jgi:hypothetical protein
MSSFQGNGPIANNLYPIANGTTSSSPFLTILMGRDPTPSDVNFQVTQRWVNTTDGQEWILLGFTAFNGSTTANWLLLNTSFVEGTFVPTISLSTPGDSAFTYSVQSGEYSVAANTVFFSIRIICTGFTNTTGSGNVQVGTLPIASGAATTNSIFACTLQRIIYSAGVSWYTGILNPSSQFIIFSGQISGAAQSLLQAAALGNPTVPNPLIINVSGVYFSS